VLWWDNADPELWYDSKDAADIADPIDPAEANEPTLANDAKDAAQPIERTESWEQIESTEFSDQSDHTARIVVAARRQFEPASPPVREHRGRHVLSAGPPVRHAGWRYR
jgi:hypothetical protein